MAKHRLKMELNLRLQVHSMNCKISNRSTASLSQEQEKRLAQTIQFTEKIDEAKENKSLFKQLQQVP